MHDARVVDEDVELAEGGQRAIDERRGARLGRDISADPDTLTAQLSRDLGRDGGVARVDDHLGPLGGKGARHGKSDASARA